MKLYEFQAKQVFAKYGIPVPLGDIADTPAEAKAVAERLGGRVVVKAHFGRAAVGPFGQDEHFDVVGSEVNVAATLPARTVSLSAEAFRCLKNGERKAYKKHTAPMVYIPVDDPRP